MTSDLPFSLLYDDDNLVVIDKPEHFHAHPPEDSRCKIPDERIVLKILRNHFGHFMYPVHRIDAPTSGCLIMAKNAETASLLSKQFEEKGLKKTYLALVRGWILAPQEIKIPLKSEDKLKLIEAHSVVEPIGSFEIPEVVGKRSQNARYTLTRLFPFTGRFHQLRRHLNHISHPIIGDVRHGDRYQNRFFAKRFLIPGLCLRAHALEFVNPQTQTLIKIEAPFDAKWTKITELLKTNLISVDQKL